MARRTMRGALAIGVVLVGCAGPAAVEKMAVSPKALVSYPSPFSKRLILEEVSGGTNDKSPGTAQVSGASFRHALQRTLQAASLLAEPPETATHAMNASLLRMDQPLLAPEMTVTCKAKYDIVEISSGRKVFEREITSSYTAKMGDGFVGTQRLKFANERAVRANFKQLLQALSEAPAGSVSQDSTH